MFSPRLLVLALIFAPFSSQPARADAATPLSPEKAKGAFLKALDRPKVPADVREAGNPVEKGNLVYSRWSFASEKKADDTVERVPVLMVAPAGAKKKLPVMIVLHGTGGNKESAQPWLEDFAKRGIIGIAIDARYHGERSGGKKGSEAYVAAITKAWQTPTGKPMEHPFYYDTVWDLWRLVDVLDARNDVDPKHIGMLGISMGGIQTWLAASVDDRVTVAAPLIGVQSFKWSLDNDKWQGRANTIKQTHEVAAKDLGEPAINKRVCRELWSKVIPGILDDYDCPNLLPLFAANSRALFIANGDMDPNCPVEGAKIAMRAAENAYAKANAKDRLVVRVNAGVGHKVTDDDRKAAIEFCTKWLK
ncbi:esterase [Gemmata sp. SH-PL17]|uniref:alpha/beta hydrolase n=1 Tax=Gemmata sp. SH-PL17 TaxID=1630693 RepID=UPI00078DE858|nr:alpha/beta fold hydrolase [Gemmata sp. SH-PL17]AMV23216.1 esterase [Gemmata sp. SH-PL17]